MTSHVIGLVGNPNCGKTTLFNGLTGSRQRVGNWPGVTVDRKEGYFQRQQTEIRIVDLPGIYSLDVLQEQSALDEKIARDYILSGEAELIVNIVDASNLERNLYLTTQLLEMGAPLLIVLNMMDIARERGFIVDVKALTRRLGCPVVPMVAAKGDGIAELKERIGWLVEQRRPPTTRVEHAPAVEQALASLAPLLPSLSAPKPTDGRWLALKLLEGDEPARRLAGPEVTEILQQALQRIEQETGEEADILIADSRYGFINALCRDVVLRKTQLRRTVSDQIDRIVLNRALGLPIFLLVMYLMFLFTINIGGAFIDFFDILAGALFVDGFTALLESLHSPAWLTTLLAQGVGGGVQIIATFIPVIGFLYLFLSFLEDSGYMARAAFVMDRLMHFIGLPGKSFVPLLVGFGCNVPAIMATRTLESQRDRLLTIAMNPFMSCGARLSVYALFAAAFFPSGGQNMVFALYLTGIGVALLTGLILKNTLLTGEATPFIMEMPPYHLPTLKSVALRAWDRLQSFVFGAGKAIIAVVIVLSFLNNLGRDGSFGNQNSEASVLSDIGRRITPVFAPLGITEDNWPATVGIFTGVFAKEAVVGTLNALYAQLAETPAHAADEPAFELWRDVRAAFSSIPPNLATALGSYHDPLGITAVGDAEAAKAQGVSLSVFGAMVSRFDGQLGAFAYLLFVLLYVPCVAASGAIYRETGLGWTLFITGWTTGVAYMAATLCYQAATFARHPAASAGWIAGLLALFLLVILTMRIIGQRRQSAITEAEAVASRL